MEQPFVEFVGITHEVATFIERLRKDTSETKNDILKRVLPVLLRDDESSRRSSVSHELHPPPNELLDIGEGAKLRVGEKLYLFLSEDAKRTRKPDGTAEARHDGLYIAGVKMEQSRGSFLQPAMELFQRRARHFNSEGKLISLSAWRQWHVVRDGRLVRLFDLKDPTRAKKRARKPVLTLEDLGLEAHA